MSMYALQRVAVTSEASTGKESASDVCVEVRGTVDDEFDNCTHKEKAVSMDMSGSDEDRLREVGYQVFVGSEASHKESPSKSDQKETPSPRSNTPSHHHTLHLSLVTTLTPHPSSSTPHSPPSASHQHPPQQPTQPAPSPKPPPQSQPHPAEPHPSNFQAQQPSQA